MLKRDVKLQLTNFDCLFINIAYTRRHHLLRFNGCLLRDPGLSGPLFVVMPSSLDSVGEGIRFSGCSALSTPATMSKQHSTLSKGRNFNAKLVRHCCRFWQQSRTLPRHCCWCGPGFSPPRSSVRSSGQIVLQPQGQHLPTNV